MHLIIIEHVYFPEEFFADPKGFFLRFGSFSIES